MGEKFGGGIQSVYNIIYNLLQYWGSLYANFLEILFSHLDVAMAQTNKLTEKFTQYFLLKKKSSLNIFTKFICMI